MQNVSAMTSELAQRPVLHRVRGQARRFWTAYWERRAANAAIAILHALDDRALEDIGIDRSEIESVVHDARDRRAGRRCCAGPAGSRSAERRITMCV